MSNIDNSSIYAGKDSEPASPELADGDIIREQDRLLPIANVARIMKQAVPTNAKIAKDAKETVQDCVSEFIAFITSEAGERCQQEKRKTINGEDIIWAMEALGFDQYSQLMKIYLQRYKEITKSDKGMMGSAQMAFENAYQMGYESMIPPPTQDTSAYVYPNNPQTN